MSSDTNSERDSWRFISVFLAAWLLLMLLPALVVAIIDPYQVFHRTFLPKVYFYKENERYQMAGLIKNYLGPCYRYRQHHYWHIVVEQFSGCSVAP